MISKSTAIKFQYVILLRITADLWLMNNFPLRLLLFQALMDFQYLDSTGRDQGINVRKKSQTLMALVNDKEKIREARQKAVENRDK